MPELSVIITTHNRTDLLRTLLDSLATQDAVDEFEVVVVVDGSTDDTVAMLGRLETPYRLIVVEQDRAGQTAARNNGARHAGGRILLFLDDDERAEPGLVAAHLRLHRGRQDVVGVGGILREVPRDADRLARLRADDGNARVRELAGRPLTYLDCYGGNCSLSKELHDRVGGHAADLSSENDYEFGFRLGNAGAEFVFLPDAIVTEFRTRAWREILIDVELRGRTAVELYRRHPAMVTTMELGGYGGWPRHWIAVRRALLPLGIPPWIVALPAFALPKAAAHRWYRHSANYAYWRGVRRSEDTELWRRAMSGTVILRYHAFAAEGEPRSRYVVSGKRFARQLGWLKKRGYNVMNLVEYGEHRARYEFAPAKTVVITADDGYVDNDGVARPILERFGYPVTVFLITEPHGRSTDGEDPALARRPVMGLADAKTIAGGVLDFGAHTRTHPDLTTIEHDRVSAEISGSRDDLEAALSVDIKTFAYPYGSSNADVRQTVERAGFLVAVGVKPGHNRPATDSFDLRRIEVRGTDSLLRFAVMLVIGEIRLRG